MTDADGNSPRSPAEVAYYQDKLTADMPAAVLISAEKRWNLDVLRQRMTEALDREGARRSATSA